MAHRQQSQVYSLSNGTLRLELNKRKTYINPTLAIPVLATSNPTPPPPPPPVVGVKSSLLSLAVDHQRIEVNNRTRKKKS